MNLAILVPAVFPSEEIARKKLWIFIESAKKAMSLRQYPVLPYGIGTTQFPGYRAMCLDMQLDYLKKLRDDWFKAPELGVPHYSHVIMTDAWDAFFTGPIDEIIAKYERLGSPPVLCSAFHQLANVSDAEKDYPGCFDPNLYYRYPNRGGYIAEIPAMIEAFEQMLRALPDTGDDCFAWYLGWKEGWFRPALDSNCEIFQVSDHECTVENGRLLNTHTQSNPCILHLSGGYTDPETGKDDRMIPWAKRLGVI